MSTEPRRELTIGELAQRSGVAPSTLRFYEERGLLSPGRTEGNQRRYPRATLRRLAVIRAAQSLGISLTRIKEAFASLPDERTPTNKDWDVLSRAWRSDLDAHIDALTRLRDHLTGCIGCGCLSIANCALFNPKDRAARKGPGPRYWMGDRPESPDP